MAATDEVRLLSLIESSHAGDVFSSFSDYLRPFSALSSTSRKQDRTVTVRSLGKQFLPFLNKSISLFPKRLSVAANPDKEARESAGDLFRAYELCLDCLESFSAQLACKPHTVQLQRLRMIYCLDAWGFYERVSAQAFKVLERLRGSGISSRKCRLLPEVQDGEAELAMVIVEAVAAVFKAIGMALQTDDKPYRTALLLLEEVRAWFRVLDAKAYEKLHRVLVTNLGKCALSLVKEAERFDGDFVRSFCDSTVKEHYKFALSKDRIYKFAREVLSVLFGLKDRRMSVTIDISMSLLRSLTCQFVADTNEDLMEFVDLVSYCAHKVRAAGDMYCGKVSKYLNEMAANFSEAIPQLNQILRLYSSGLSITVYDSTFGESKVKDATDDWKIQALLDDEARWQSLVSLLAMVDSYSGAVRNQTDGSLIGGHKNYNNKTNDSCKNRNKKTCWPQYVDALSFLCQPLADLINSVKRKIVLKSEMPCASAHLSTIHDVFLQYCDGCLFLQRCPSDTGGRATYNNKALLNVAMAAFIISLRTQLKLEISAHLVEDVITSPWIRSQELKYLLASLYNIGVVLYRNKELEKACEALRLCSKASWRCVELHCQMFENQSSSSDNDLSEDAIMEFVGESCNRCAFYLDILQQCSSCKIRQTIVHSLENWLSAEHLIRRLPGPAAIVKQWVKIERGCHTDLDAADSCTTLYSLLSSSKKKSKRAIGKILQQELLAYDEMFPLSSNLGQQTRIEIADILLKDVYVTEDMHLERARILIWKARMTRTFGTERLTDCIDFLSEAISILSEVHHRPNKEGAPSSHQLPIAYCLRAFCIQEAEPNSKKVLEDISTSLNLWLEISCLDDSGASLPTVDIIPLLYNMIDLMSVKGCTELHHHIYQLIFRLFKQKNVKLEVCLAMLWECRRLSHALCPSPISDVFILALSENCGDRSTCIDFWIDCLKDSKAKLIGFQQNFHDLHDFLRTSNKVKSPFQSDITIDGITDAASELISSASLSGPSSFFAAYLYYDLCERLISFGKLSEALSYAKEAYRIRTLIFQEKFKYTAEKQFEKHNDAGKISEIRTFSITNFQVFKSVATDFWPCGNFLWDINRSYLSRWNVLQCYLESTLQVGIVNELIGNGGEAETLLSWGKAISCSQSLFPFVVAFSSALGNLYHKKQSLDLAEKELQNAKEIIIANQREFSCVKCKLRLEVTLDKQLGDISRKQIVNAARVSETDGFLHAESLFSAALGKICCSAWQSCLRSHGVEISEGIAIAKNGGEFLGSKSSKTKLNKKPTEGKDTRRGRRAKSSQTGVSKDHDLIYEPTSRLTRSMRQSLKEQCQNCTNAPEAVLKKPSFCHISDGSGGERVLLETKNAVHGFCICYKGKCMQCLSVEVTESGSLNSLVSLKWELCHRRLASSILVNLGKCLADSGRVRLAHEALLHSISVLFKSNWSSHDQPSVSQLLEFIGKEVTRDVFAIDRAIILNNLCWLSLRNYHCRESRSICCDLSHIPFTKLVSWLMLAFILSREVPILFQKVSRLLACLYLLSASSAEFSFECDGNELSASHWVSYFHQASLGTHISYQFISNLSRRHKSQCLSDKEVTERGCIGIFSLSICGLTPVASKCTEATCSSCMVPDELDLPRLAPERTQDLVQFSKEFFNNLPSSTIICISLLGGALNQLLQELLQIRSPVCAWVLVSRFNMKSQPVATLLPVDSVLEDMSDDSGNLSSTEATQVKNLERRWLCPWGSTVVDDVAPAFKSIMEESHTYSGFPVEDTKENRCLWWKRRKKLDHHLGKFLRSLEASWLGPWRCLLLGDLSNYKLPDSVQKKLVKDLKSKCKMEVNEMLLKIILGGGIENFKGEACVAQLSLRNGCYVGRGGYLYEEDSCKTPTAATNISESRHGLALQLIHEAATKLEQHDGHENREPIILVLDPEVQMLPWENIPILRKQEVYRMPSVGSISAVLKKRCLQGEPARSNVASFPLIDPLDSFYLLNPGGDLSETQIVFESWFRDQNFEGKAGLVPSAEELTEALKNHDLFLYFGHGSGAQYLSRHEIEKLDNCSATFLMGCSSGSLWLKGCYIPQGIPLSYLLAGSPAIVATLWDVTDRDIDRFGKALLEAWLRERSDSSSSSSEGGCSQCESLANELAAMNIKGNNNTKRSRKPSSRNKPAQSNADGSGKVECNHKHGRKIGSFIAAAREACTLPYLIGAAPVCYGVPTGITRKKKS
ncbi:separase isoform X2 [Eutrema salsugineum]|uniref:separase isoform X2 n=1 Tax=Eutrema salsugineum TaxID=72664 RepID=UPI000CECF0ED|nr:separase isoform X2 [Eutrema salsugineum]